MSLQDHAVNIDLFEVIETPTGFAFPCSACKYNVVADYEYPCVSCDHNSNCDSANQRFCTKGVIYRMAKITLTTEQLIRLYNIGYNAGHNDTVEGQDCPAHHTEMDTHHQECVLEILDDMQVDNA